jgi:DNA polymerase III epsilon subunit-like protein
MIHFFTKLWNEVPIVGIDTETTGLRAGYDRAVQVALVRFEGGAAVGELVSFVDPGIPIPAEATAIHGIGAEQVAGAARIEDLFQTPEALALLEGAQPLAYNAGYDRNFVPPFGERWDWPWFDCLSAVRAVDRFAKGPGRHRLENTAPRHGVTLSKAHDAGADARATGELFYRVIPKLHGCDHLRGKLPEPAHLTVGQLICWQRKEEAVEWFRFHDWLSRQPPREAVSA